METLLVMLRNVRWPLLLILLHSVTVYLFKKIGLFEGISLSEAFTSIGTSATAVVMIQSFRFRISYERWREADVLWRSTKAELISFFTLLSYHLGVLNETHQSQQILERVKESFISFVKKLHDLTVTHHRLLISSKEKMKTQVQIRGEALYEIIHLELSQILGSCFKDKTLPIEQARYFNLHLTNLLVCAENLLRIRATRTPRYYRNFSVFLIYFLSLVSPYLLVASLEAAMIPLVLINASIFLMLDQMSDRGEMPFGERKSDVPSHQIIQELESQLNQHLASFRLSNKRNAA